MGPETKPVKPSGLIQADVALRLLLFVTTLVPLVVMVTSKQTVRIGASYLSSPLVIDAKFSYSPALVYFVAAMSVACSYSLVTTAASAICSYKLFSREKLLLVFGFLDAVMVGVVTSATGAVASIAYVGLKGNSHVGWMKICDIYDKFCRHIGSSLIMSLVASLVLVLLITVSTYTTLYHRSR